MKPKSKIEDVWSDDEIKDCARQVLSALLNARHGEYLDTKKIYADFCIKYHLPDNAIIKDCILRLAYDAWNESRRAAGVRIGL